MRYFRIGDISPLAPERDGYFSTIVATDMVSKGVMITCLTWGSRKDIRPTFESSCFSNEELLDYPDSVEVGIEEWVRAKTLFMDNTLAKY